MYVRIMLGIVPPPPWHADSPAFKAKQAKYPDFFRDPRNVICVLNADGASVCANENTVWPIVCQLLNLPPAIRSKYENLLWYGFCEGKPKTRLLYEAFVAEALELWETGCRIYDGSTGEVFTCRLMVHVAIFDYKGLVDVLHHKDVGAYCPCVKCNLPGVHSKAQGRVWYANRNHDAADLKDWTIEEVLQIIRQHEQIAAGLKAAGTCPDEIKKVIADVGRTTGWNLLPCLALLPYFCIIRDILLDHMHMFQNLSRNLHTTLHGDDWGMTTRSTAKELGEHKPWWPEVPLMPSPFAVPTVTAKGE